MENNKNNLDMNAGQIIIDTKREITPKKYAEMKGVTLSAVTNMIYKGKLKIKKYPELNNLILVQIPE